MIQKFSNNAKGALAATLSSGGTSMTVTDLEGFAALNPWEYELVTIEANAEIEVVKVIAHAGADWTIERAQDGTTAREWASGTQFGGRLTAATLGGLVQGVQYTGAAGAYALSMIPAGDSAAGAEAEKSLAVGWGANASEQAVEAVAVGGFASAPHAVAIKGACQAEAGVAVGLDAFVGSGSGNAVALGRHAEVGGSCPGAIALRGNAAGERAFCVGWGEDKGGGANAAAYGEESISLLAQAAGDGDVAVGARAMADGGGAPAVALLGQAFGPRAVAVGYGAAANSPDCLAMLDAMTGADLSIAIGKGALAGLSGPGQLSIAALPMIQHPGMFSEGTRELTNPALQLSGLPVILTTEFVDLATLGDYTLTLPSGLCYVDEVGLWIGDSASVSVNPQIQVGSASDGDALVAPVELTETGPFARTLLTVLDKASPFGEFVFAVTSAATAATLTARFYVRGMLLAG